ncbi:MAG: hypothetical protein K0Q79_577 [Flavipsychrobacter sp.]|jgi:hypothetical protein|nr:hypothetical protein [Flavipsychrobacter sp.]
MKQLFIAFVLLCGLNGLAQVKNDLANEGLKGRVKMVTEIEYVDERMTKPFMKTVDKYNIKGNLTETIHDDYVLKQHSRNYIKYDTDANGMVTKHNEFNDTGMLVRMVIYRYDTLKQITEEEDHRYYDGRETVYRNEYTYDSHKKLLHEQNYVNGLLHLSVAYTYDNAGKLTGSKSHDTAGKQVGLTDYQYYPGGGDWIHCEKQAENSRTHVFRILDSTGCMIEKTTYTDDYAKQTNETNLKFDKQGNWLIQSVKGTITEHFFISRRIEYYK